MISRPDHVQPNEHTWHSFPLTLELRCKTFQRVQLVYSQYNSNGGVLPDIILLTLLCHSHHWGTQINPMMSFPPPDLLNVLTTFRGDSYNTILYQVLRIGFGIGFRFLGSGLSYVQNKYCWSTESIPESCNLLQPRPSATINSSEGLDAFNFFFKQQAAYI